MYFEEFLKKKKHPKKGSEKECDTKCQQLINSANLHIVVDLDGMYRAFRKTEIVRTSKDGSLAFLDIKNGKTQKGRWTARNLLSQ